MTTRPLIAVTGVPIVAGGVLGWQQGALAVPVAYLESLDVAGADGVILMPVELDEQAAADRLSRFDGLLMVGGGDIEPARYGAEAGPEVSYVNPVRDGFEIPLVRVAVEREIPTLAICRGHQVLNVALGGTLHQHITDWMDHAEHRGADGEGVVHPVRVLPGCRLRKAMDVERAATYSHHHQAVDQLGTGLVPVAWADDGIIEGIEHERGWIVGVQWHAEATAATDPVQQKIFHAFVEQARSA